jgi:hypothetical protein
MAPGEILEGTNIFFNFTEYVHGEMTMHVLIAFLNKKL